MPQLVKGGKHTFGWSRVNADGKIVIPPDAIDEYQLSSEKYAYLLSGSKKSGGFGLTTLNTMKTPLFSKVLLAHPTLQNPETISGKCLNYGSRVFCVVPFKHGSIMVPLAVLKYYGVKPDSMLLTVRGSHTALGFIVRGPIIGEAKRHPELQVFE